MLMDNSMHSPPSIVTSGHCEGLINNFTRSKKSSYNIIQHVSFKCFRNNGNYLAYYEINYVLNDNFVLCSLSKILQKIRFSNPRAAEHAAYRTQPDDNKELIGVGSSTTFNMRETEYATPPIQPSNKELDGVGSLIFNQREAEFPTSPIQPSIKESVSANSSNQALTVTHRSMERDENNDLGCPISELLRRKARRELPETRSELIGKISNVELIGAKDDSLVLVDKYGYATTKSKAAYLSPAYMIDNITPESSLRTSQPYQSLYRTKQQSPLRNEDPSSSSIYFNPVEGKESDHLKQTQANQAGRVMPIDDKISYQNIGGRAQQRGEIRENPGERLSSLKKLNENNKPSMPMIKDSTKTFLEDDRLKKSVSGLRQYPSAEIRPAMSRLQNTTEPKITASVKNISKQLKWQDSGPDFNPIAPLASNDGKRDLLPKTDATSATPETVKSEMNASRGISHQTSDNAMTRSQSPAKPEAIPSLLNDQAPANVKDSDKANAINKKSEKNFKPELMSKGSVRDKVNQIEARLSGEFKPNNSLNRDMSFQKSNLLGSTTRSMKKEGNNVVMPSPSVRAKNSIKSDRIHLNNKEDSEKEKNIMKKVDGRDERSVNANLEHETNVEDDETKLVEGVSVENVGDKKLVQEQKPKVDENYPLKSETSSESSSDSNTNFDPKSNFNQDITKYQRNGKKLANVGNNRKTNRRAFQTFTENEHEKNRSSSTSEDREVTSAGSGRSKKGLSRKKTPKRKKRNRRNRRNEKKMSKPESISEEEELVYLEEQNKATFPKQKKPIATEFDDLD